MTIDPKFQEATLPLNETVAIHMAMDREQWAKEARNKDQYGSAREFELTAKLLRFFAQKTQQENR